MASNSKRLKLSKQCQLESDIISSLPCGVIAHILSFLSTKEAVSTSILSTKWKDIWHLISKLNLTDNSFSVEEFTPLVYRLLLQRRGSHLRDFYLNCRRSYDPLDVNAWIKYALLCKVQQVDISLSLKTDSFLCRELFSSTTLTSLRLKASFTMNICYTPSFVHLPNLKTVDLSFVKFVGNGYSLNWFICSCPVLEELTLYRCLGEDVDTINIDSPLLTKLVLKDMMYVDATNKFEPAINREIVIDTPSLKYLELENFFAGGYSIIDLHNVIEAHVALTSDFSYVLFTHYTANTVITDLLEGISNVQSLHISWFDIVFNWPEDYFQLPQFPNLSSLELIVGNKCDLLPEMLENSPCLETLVYKEADNPYSSKEWKNESRAFDCCSVSKSLKVIEIDILHGLKCADIMVYYFSKNAKALMKLIVQSVNLDNELEDNLEMVTCFLKYNDKKIKKFTMENITRRLRKWVFDY